MTKRARGCAASQARGTHLGPATAGTPGGDGETEGQPTPPGARHMRTAVRSTLIAGLTGTLMVSAAWAGIGISPLPIASSAPEVSTPLGAGKVAADAPTTSATGTATTAAALSGGQVLAGAAKASMTPRPDD